MTTIAALVDKGRVWMGADSAVTFEGSGIQSTMRAPKIFRCGPLLVGASGSVPWGEAWRRWKPRRSPPRDFDTWIAEELDDFVNSLRYEEEEDDRSELLVGFRGSIWITDTGGGAWRVAEPWEAIGSGSQVARGVLQFTGDRKTRSALKLEARDRLKASLESAEKLDAFTRRPFRFLREGDS